ncbi:MAG: hypothetical protein PUG18_04440 [Lachnospiraceae bacterium]|nr:hypothetical protein [Lachnospiraceae bacterium]
MKKYFETAFYVYLAFIVLKSMLTATMIPVNWWNTRVENILQLAALGMVMWKAASDDVWTARERVLAVFLCGSLLLSWHSYSYAFIYELAVLIFLAHGMEFRKILTVHLAVSLAVTLVTVILALSGRIENLTYYQESHNYRARMAFGFLYPTDFCAHLFFMTLSYVWLRLRRIRWGEIAAIAVLGIFTWVCCDARTTTLLFALLVLRLGIMKLRAHRASSVKSADLAARGSRTTRAAQRSAERRTGTAQKSAERRAGTAVFSCFREWIDWLIVLSAPIFAALMILMSRFYSESSRFLRFVNRALNKRLYYGHIGFDRYNVRLWAQNVEMHGAGGAVKRTTEYFFLDSSYVNILLRLGLVVLAAMLMILVITANRERKTGDHLKLFLLFLIIAACVIEHHLIEIQANPFLLLVLAADDGQRDDFHVSRTGIVDSLPSSDKYSE